MNHYLGFIHSEQAKRTIENLEKHGIHGYFFHNREEAVEKILSMIPKGGTIASGGSETLTEIGLTDALRNGAYPFLPSPALGMTAGEIKNLQREALLAEIYISSANAITEEGEILNVDGTGNRVAAMAFGPDKVIIVVGINKLVKNVQEAVERVKRIAGPSVNLRADSGTPCTKTGYCADCQSPERKCNVYSVIKHQRNPERLYVFIINETLGF